MAKEMNLTDRRFEVIADYPNSPFKKGCILIQYGVNYIVDKRNITDVFCVDTEKYPHLFKPLAWFERRTVEEMPEYVKNEKGEILKANQWCFSVFWTCECSDDNAYMEQEITPATLSDYEAYKTKQHE